MLDSIVSAIENFFLNTVGEELCAFFCSMIPIIELRGAIPLGAGLGLPWWQSYILAVLGNMLPVHCLIQNLKPLQNLPRRARLPKLSTLNSIWNTFVLKSGKKQDFYGGI